MPELPEAQTIARTLDEGIRGVTVARVMVLRRDVIHGDPRPLPKVLMGLRITRVYRRAKQVILEFEQPAATRTRLNSQRLSKASPTGRYGTKKRRIMHSASGSNAGGQVLLAFRLGMTGRLTLVVGNTPVEPHTHLRLRFSDTVHELRFRDPRRFGGAWCLTDHPGWHGRILRVPGPEPLDMSPTTFQRLLRRKRPIKSLLLDQSLIAGIGNIYCDEALFRANIHPLRSAVSLSPNEGTRLLNAVKTVLQEAIAHQGSTMMDYRTPDGVPGGFQHFHAVYQRHGQPCRRCGSPIVRLAIVQRSSFFCPTCQAPPSSSSAPL